MRKNRTLPYGYHIINGAVHIHEAEAEVVRRVFRAYAEGSSYKAIAQALTQSGSRYTAGKPEWNKNIIARMLQNKIYLGTELYPPLLDEAAYSMAQDARKPYTLRQAPELKAVCGMLVCGVCGSPVRRRNKSDGTERWYCAEDYRHIPASLTDAALLSRLGKLVRQMAATPERIADGHTKECDDLRFLRLENEINAMLDRGAVQPEELLAMILRLASDRYEARSGADAQSAKIRNALREGGGVSLLPEIADHIAISSGIVVSVTLKNGQNISEGESFL